MKVDFWRENSSNCYSILNYKYLNFRAKNINILKVDFWRENSHITGIKHDDVQNKEQKTSSRLLQFPLQVMDENGNVER